MTDQGTDSQVSAAEIARLAGVGRAAVSNWRRRFPSFPAPSGGTTTSPSFSLNAVERWLREQGKLQDVDAVDRVWHSLDSLRSGDDAADGLVLAGVALHAAHAGVAPGSDVATIRTSVPVGVSRLVADDDWPVIQRLCADLGRVDDAADLFEQLYQRFTQATLRSIVVTPEPLVSTMLDLLEPIDGTLFDPACGAASFLRTTLGRHAGLRVVGQEIDGGLARVATVRLAFIADGVSAPQIATGDSLFDDAWPDVRADAAVCHPPFAQRHWGAEDLAYDPRWEYGLPPRSESELAWVEHTLAHVKPGGRAVILMPPAAATRRSGRRIRAELLRRGALRGVIALPPGAATPLGIPLTLWVLRRPAEDSTASDVLFVDVSMRRDGRHVDWSEVFQDIVSTWRAFDRGDDLNDVAIAAAVPVVDLLDEDVDLSPATRVRPAGTDIDVEEVRMHRDALQVRLSSLVQSLPEIDEAPTPAIGATVSVGDLVKSGAVELFQHAGRVPEASEGDGVPVLGGRDVVTGSAATRRVAEAADSLHELRPGDIVIVAIAQRIHTRVIDEPGIRLGPGLVALRPDPQIVDGWFLAGCLRASSNERFSATLAGTMRVDVRRCVVPRLPLDDQQSYGRAFERLAEVEAGLVAVARDGNDLIAQVTDGLAAGTIRVTS